MSKVNLTVHTFRMDTDKEASLKPLEEAAEVYAAWQDYDAYRPQQECIEDGFPNCTRECKSLCETYNNPRSYEVRRDELGDEIADCIQACVNLADRYGIDLQAAIERCEKRNRERGRYE